MEATARFALCVALTNITEDNDWMVCKRLAKILTTSWKNKHKRRLHNLLKTKEIYNIPCALKLLSLDKEEWKHLMKCISQNDMGGNSTRNKNNEEVYAETENWKMETLETVGFKTLCVCEDHQNPLDR